jgi:hypothetical protein
MEKSDLERNGRGKLWAVIGLGFSVAVIIVAVILQLRSGKGKENAIEEERREELAPVLIVNYAEYVRNLPENERESIEQMLRYVINLNGRGEAIPEDAEIRGNSYAQSKTGEEFESTFVVDIPSVQQSYRVIDYYDPAFRGEEVPRDYMILVVCLEKSAWIYEDFWCQDRFSVEFDMPWSDAVLRSVPYEEADFAADVEVAGYDSRVRKVILRVEVKTERGAAEAALGRWLESRGLAMRDYVVDWGR